LQSKTNFLEDVTVLRVPAFYQFSYIYDWEWDYLPTIYSKFYKALRTNERTGAVVCNRWEIEEDFGINGTTGDEGTHYTQTWEAFTGITPGLPVRIRLPQNFNSAKAIFWHREPVAYTTEKELANTDPIVTGKRKETLGTNRLYRPK